MRDLIFELFNLLFSLNFPIYKKLYFLYKSYSEKEEIDYFKSTIKPGMTVVDVGANIGFYTLLFARLVGSKGVVISFEPDIENFKKLKQLTGEIKNIKIHNFAVGEKDGVTKIYYSDSLNVDHQTYDNGEKRKFKEIKLVSLDSFLKSKKVDLVKIDVQGFDYFVLKGMNKKILKQKEIIVVSEVWPYGLTKAGSSVKQLLEILKINKFSFKSFVERNYDNKEKDRDFYGNIYAIKSLK